MLCAIPTLAWFGRDKLKDWFTDVPLMLLFAGIILLIWLLDRLWLWEEKGTVGIIFANLLYYVLVIGAVALTVYGCMTEFGGSYADDYLVSQMQIFPLCLPLSLLVFYTVYFRWEHNEPSGSVLMHILPLRRRWDFPISVRI